MEPSYPGIVSNLVELPLKKKRRRMRRRHVPRLRVRKMKTRALILLGLAAWRGVGILIPTLSGPVKVGELGSLLALVPTSGLTSGGIVTTR
jgi:hypothetical protein